MTLLFCSLLLALNYNSTYASERQTDWLTDVRLHFVLRTQE